MAVAVEVTGGEGRSEGIVVVGSTRNIAHQGEWGRGRAWRPADVDRDRRGVRVTVTISGDVVEGGQTSRGGGGAEVAVSQFPPGRQAVDDGDGGCGIAGDIVGAEIDRDVLSDQSGDFVVRRLWDEVGRDVP